MEYRSSWPSEERFCGFCDAQRLFHVLHTIAPRLAQEVQRTEHAVPILHWHIDHRAEAHANELLRIFERETDAGGVVGVIRLPAHEDLAAPRGIAARLAAR